MIGRLFARLFEACDVVRVPVDVDNHNQIRVRDVNTYPSILSRHPSRSSGSSGNCNTGMYIPIATNAALNFPVPFIGLFLYACHSMFFLLDYRGRPETGLRMKLFVRT